MLNIFKKKCSICGKKNEGYGNNARPVNDGKCCDYCNANVVIPARIYQWKEDITSEVIEELKKEGEVYARN